jgi:LacI family transcriptional regulator
MAFHSVCKERGLDPGETLTYVNWKAYAEDESKKALLHALQSRRNVTAVVAKNDVNAVTIYNLLTANGFRIPEDISLMGYDDTEILLDDHSNNILTTVRLPLREIGGEAAKFLIKRITGIVKKDREIILPTELVVRRTTSEPRS